MKITQGSTKLPPATSICRSSPGLLRMPGKGLSAWCPFALMLSLNTLSVSIFFCLKPALLCLRLNFFKGKPSCVWSLTCGQLSPDPFIPCACINLCGCIDSKSTSTPELNGITLPSSINFCITGVSFPYVKEMLSTITIIIHVTGSEHTFRGASAECNASCPPATQNKRLCVNNINGCMQPVQMKSGLLLISLQGFHVLRLFVYSGGQIVPESIKHWKNDQSFFCLFLMWERETLHDREINLKWYFAEHLCSLSEAGIER